MIKKRLWNHPLQITLDFEPWPKPVSIGRETFTRTMYIQNCQVLHGRPSRLKATRNCIYMGINTSPLYVGLFRGFRPPLIQEASGGTFRVDPYFPLPHVTQKALEYPHSSYKPRGALLEFLPGHPKVPENTQNL